MMSFITKFIITSIRPNHSYPLKNMCSFESNGGTQFNDPPGFLAHLVLYIALPIYCIGQPIFSD